MKILHADADYSDKTPVAGFYAWDGSEYHGPFADEDEARAFVECCEVEDRAEARHNASLRHPN